MRSRPAVIGAAIIASFAVLAGACRQQGANGAPPDESTSHEHHHVSASSTTGHGHTAGHGTDEVLLTTGPETPQAGQRALLNFAFTDDSGRPVDDLMTHHGRKLHVLIVSEDMQVFGHIHPQDFDEAIERGNMRVWFGFPQAGRYAVVADFMTGRGSHARQFDIAVSGAIEAAAIPDRAAFPPSVRVVELEEGDGYTQPIFLSGGGEADGYTLSLQKPDEIRAGEPVSLIYRFSRYATPVTDLRPYLEAALHLAVVKDDLSQFLHEHGTANPEAHSDHSGHGGHESAEPASFGPEVTAVVTFPEPGTYYLFGQAAHGNKLLNSRFSIEVL